MTTDRATDENSPIPPWLERTIVLAACAALVAVGLVPSRVTTVIGVLVRGFFEHVVVTLPLLALVVWAVARSWPWVRRLLFAEVGGGRRLALDLFVVLVVALTWVGLPSHVAFHVVRPGFDELARAHVRGDDVALPARVGPFTVDRIRRGLEGGVFLHVNRAGRTSYGFALRRGADEHPPFGARSGPRHDLAGAWSTFAVRDPSSS